MFLVEGKIFSCWISYFFLWNFYCWSQINSQCFKTFEHYIWKVTFCSDTNEKSSMLTAMGLCQFQLFIFSLALILTWRILADNNNVGLRCQDIGCTKTQTMQAKPKQKSQIQGEINSLKLLSVASSYLRCNENWNIWAECYSRLTLYDGVYTTFACFAKFISSPPSKFTFLQ